MPEPARKKTRWPKAKPRRGVKALDTGYATRKVSSAELGGLIDALSAPTLGVTQTLPIPGARSQSNACEIVSMGVSGETSRSGPAVRAT